MNRSLALVFIIIVIFIGLPGCGGSTPTGAIKIAQEAATEASRAAENAFSAAQRALSASGDEAVLYAREAEDASRVAHAAADRARAARSGAAPDEYSAIDGLIAQADAAATKARDDAARVSRFIEELGPKLTAVNLKAEVMDPELTKVKREWITIIEDEEGRDLENFEEQLLKDLIDDANCMVFESRIKAGRPVTAEDLHEFLLQQNKNAVLSLAHIPDSVVLLSELIEIGNKAYEQGSMTNEVEEDLSELLCSVTR